MSKIKKQDGLKDQGEFTDVPGPATRLSTETPTPVDELPDQAIFHVPSMANPNQFIAFTKNAVVMEKRPSSLFEPKQATEDELREAFPSFELGRRVTLPLRIDSSPGLVLPYGLTVLSGQTASGKSRVLKSMDKRGAAMMRALAVEPFDTDDELDTIQHVYNSVDSALAALVVARLKGSIQIPVVDSFRESLYEIAGPAGSKGVVNAFFTALTRVSNALAKARITIVAVLNPMADDAAYIAEFKSKLSSAIPCVIWLDPYTGPHNDDERTTAAGTVSMRPARTPMAFSYDSGDAVANGVAARDFVAGAVFNGLLDEHENPLTFRDIATLSKI